MLNLGDHVIVITDNTRIPKGTECVVEAHTSTLDQYYIRNVDSQYCCWSRESDLQPIRGRYELCQ